ncbi:MAG: pyruvate:ferredoxin (flavodoxin) oxidoreductase, partial [Clostridia bacterium]|nr:pyruvate:ferredoxin (flavodoxin) oxidoreductase [Clostridia bacterium]
MSEKKLVTMDGNEAAAYISYAFTEIAAIYPITPSSPMAGKTDAWSAVGKKNIFGQTVSLVEMQSEAGAIAAVHGSLETGALSASFTSSQGLMLMIPVLHRISGERLPGVLHVASRTVGTHALSIFGDHSDVYNCRQTGFAMLSTSSVQEIMDLAGVAHLSAIKSRIPFMHFFDGFRTSHQIDKVEQMEYDDLAKLVDYEALNNYKRSALNPEHPDLRATVQNPDIFFQVREANNKDYDELVDIVEDYMAQISKITGRNYHLFNYYGAADAENVIVAMGSVSETVSETVDYINKNGGKVGFLQVHLYRPFSAKHFVNALPKTVKKVAVLDRTKEMGAVGEPLYTDVRSVLYGKDITVVGGRYGLSSKDTTPSDILAVFENLASDNPKNGFTVSINDDVTHLSLTPSKIINGENDDTVSCKFWGLGSDGTVGANHSTVKIINDHTDKYAQAYFEYDAKKSFGVTKSHLRFSSSPIRSTYYVKNADFIACHNQSYIYKYDIACELKEGGTFLLNCSFSEDELESRLPVALKKQLAEKKAKFYIIDAAKIADEIGLHGRINMVLQSAFFTLANVIDPEEAKNYMIDSAKKTYFAKGEDVVNKNVEAILRGASAFVKIDVPESWMGLADMFAKTDMSKPEVVTQILEPINNQKGDDLPVSVFEKYKDGRIELGLTAFEKRAISENIPVWHPDKCIQCNKCAFVCPHAVIRPYLLSEDEVKNAPKQMKYVAANGTQAKGFYYTLSISGADCTGCGSCVNNCLAKEKAITMEHVSSVPTYDEVWEYTLKTSDKGEIFDRYTVKGSQFRTPLLEFSAACAGCGETPYAKLLTQLFGDKVYWANATGCSQAWGSPMPGIPYTKNAKGKGPAWSNSLFENNAEFSLGMLIADRKQRELVKMNVEKLVESPNVSETLKLAANNWIATYDDLDANEKATEEFVALLEKADKTELTQTILRDSDRLSKKCFWMFGGDGWAYDIGFGGLDHVIASGEDVNVFVVDTEVYSNTGGQSSKATPLGAVAQFCASGKKSKKKDLGAMLMTYGNVYVAQVAMGADSNQLVKAVKEAQNYKGPSVIIAYTP